MALLRSIAPGRPQGDRVGRLELGETRGIYVGAPLGVGFHRGAVACFALALDGTLTVSSTGPRARAGKLTCALIGAGLRHRIEATGGQVAFLYLDPSDALVRVLRAQLSASHALLHIARDGALRQRFGAGGLSAYGPPLRTALDPRISRVLRMLREGQLLSSTAGEAAAAVKLSPSRFMHLFRAQVGVPFRRFRLWARLRFAIARVAAGATLTEAAMESELASPSHFSDAFRAMFGVPPSVLRSVQIELRAT
jgi:AraC-like DNA-binding protein